MLSKIKITIDFNAPGGQSLSFEYSKTELSPLQSHRLRSNRKYKACLNAGRITWNFLLMD